MKLTLLLLITFTVVCFKSKWHNLPDQFAISSNSGNPDSCYYRVYKIDSVNTYYIIYANQKGSIFKIISPKERIIGCNKITIDKIYKLDLYSLLFVKGKPIIPANLLYQLSGWRVDDSTTINFEGDSIRNLYQAKNLKGLCLINKKLE